MYSILYIVFNTVQNNTLKQKNKNKMLIFN